MPQTETKYRLYNVNCSDWRGLHLPPLLWALSLTHFTRFGDFCGIYSLGDCFLEYVGISVTTCAVNSKWQVKDISGTSN